LTKRIRFILVAFLAALYALRCTCAFDRAFRFRDRYRGTSYASHFWPGLASTVQWIGEHGYGEVRGSAIEPDPYVLQRLSEMLYPIPYRPTSIEGLAPGDMVVLFGNEDLPRPHAVVFEDGVLRVVRVEK